MTRKKENSYGKKIFKLIISILLFFSFISCTATTKLYSYKGCVFENNQYSSYPYRDYIYTSEKDQLDKNTFLSSISFTPNKKYKKLEILSDKIKLVYEGKDYYLEKDYFFRGKEKVPYYPIYKKGIIINGDFMLYIGNVRLDDKEIVKIPPLKFRKYVWVSKGNSILEGFKVDTNVDIYRGPLEDYKGE